MKRTEKRLFKVSVSPEADFWGGHEQVLYVYAQNHELAANAAQHQWQPPVLDAVVKDVAYADVTKEVSGTTTVTYNGDGVKTFKGFANEDIYRWRKMQATMGFVIPAMAVAFCAGLWVSNFLP